MAKKTSKKEISRQGAATAGVVHGNISNASTLYGEEKFHASRGHGFAAERANTLHDRLTGHDTRLVGDDNAKNGADRIVDNRNIQSKYCRTGGKCIKECFENGRFRYLDNDGAPMQIEVPSDKYESAVKAMEERIRKGEVPGINNPEEAVNIVRQGKFSYEQAKNIAKAGTVESITYDAVNGSIIATNTFGITAALSFATSVWNGEDLDIALKNAAADGLKVGGATFISAILAGQFTKAGLNSALVGGSEGLVNLLGAKGSAVLVNAFRSGTNIYGAAAMKSAAKMLRGNTITGIASIVILSSGDIINLFRGRISGSQLLKNVVETTSTVAGGTAGWIGGATAGAAIGSVVPVVGTAIGGIIGGLAGAFGGGSLASHAANKALDNLIEDDANKMVKIMESVFVELATDYLLTEHEIEDVLDSISKNITGTDLKDMYASDNRKYYAKMLILPYVERKTAHRERISTKDLTPEKLQHGLHLVLEELADNQNRQNNIKAELV